MTTQVHTAGPGVETYRSTRFAATVNGTTAYVYGWTKEAEFASPGAWEANDSIELSCFTYGANEETTVVVSLVSGTITSAVVYPKAHGITPTVAGGTATIVVSVANLRKPLRVEVNGDNANVLYIHPHALKSTPPGGYVTYNETQTSVPDGTCLLFPAGAWTLPEVDGVKFKVGEGSTVYLDEGSVVIGQFDLRPTSTTIASGISIRGPGIMSGEWLDNEDLPDGTFAEQLEYSMICGYVAGTFASGGNTLAEFTIVRTPFYAIGLDCINAIEDVHIYSPWNNNTDGFRVIGDALNANIATIDNSSSWTGDDALIVEHYYRHVTVTNCFTSSSYSSAINLGYEAPDVDYGWTTTINDHYIRASADYYIAPDGDDEGGAAIQCWVDETTAGGAAGYGRYRVTIDGLYYEGDSIRAPLFSIKNNPDPWGEPNDGAGNIARFSLSNINVETVPDQVSFLIGLDADNTPHDITFADITIGGVLVTDANWSTYVQQNAYPYNITVDDEAPEPGQNDPDFVVEEGDGDEDANAYCTVAFADAYHANYGNPTTWSTLTTEEKQDAIRQATRIADDRYAQRWTGVRGSSEQALDWPRAYGVDSAGNEIDSAVIPTKLQQWTARAALDFANGALEPSDEEPSIVSESLSSASGASKTVTYTSPKRQDTEFVALDRMLVSAGLISSGGGWGHTTA